MRTCRTVLLNFLGLLFKHVGESTQGAVRSLQTSLEDLTSTFIIGNIELAAGKE